MKSSVCGRLLPGDIYEGFPLTEKSCETCLRLIGGKRVPGVLWSKLRSWHALR